MWPNDVNLPMAFNSHCVQQEKVPTGVYRSMHWGGGSRTHQTDLSHLRVTCYFVYHLERRLNMKMNAVDTSTVTRQVYADMNNAKYSRKFQINSSIVLQCHEVIMCCCSHSMAYFSYGVSRHIHSSTSRSTYVPRSNGRILDVCIFFLGTRAVCSAVLVLLR